MLLLSLYQYMSLSEVDNNILCESLTGDEDHFNKFSGKTKMKYWCPFSGVNCYLLVLFSVVQTVEFVSFLQ